MIQDNRVRRLNDLPPRDGHYVLYWMQQSQRARFNPALELAVREANRAGLPVIVGFGLMDDYPESNARHYAFLLEGLQDVEAELGKRKIKLVVRRGSPPDVAQKLARRASLVVCDRGYLRHQRKWRQELAIGCGCRVLEVEGDVLVPVEQASDKQEYAARTIRPKLTRRRDEYIRGLSATSPRKDSRRLDVTGDVDLSNVPALLRRLRVDASVKPVRRFRGGSFAARRALAVFLRHRLDGYDAARNEPSRWHSSLLSPYLHFGHLSPVEIAQKVLSVTSGKKKDREGLLEELLVRRELAVNFVYFNADYDSYRCLPDWARKTLAEHAADERAHVYTRKELERADTHDRYWNAAMREMVHTGFMHNYMRMYWGKKILEWCRTPEYAYRTTLHLNNKYFLDGRDPNSFANVAGCYGLHDRGWTERKIFGKVRYMNDRGLERKFDMDAYVDEVEKLVAAERGD